MKIQQRFTFLLIVILGFTANVYSNPDSLYKSANDYYTISKFDSAANIYQQLVDSGFVNVDLYFNLGNAYFKLNRIPQAILYYERAYVLSPDDEDIEFNLEYAKTFTIDRIEPLPEFFAIKWFRGVSGILSSNGWALASILFFAVTLSLLLLFWFSVRPRIKRLSFALALLTFLIMGTTILFSKQEKSRITQRNYAIVFQPVVAVKSSPGETGKDIFILHAGTKVKVTKKLGEWSEIRIADGNKGWIPSNSVEVI